MLFNKLSMNTNFFKRIALFIFIGFLTLLMIKVKVDHIVLWDAIFQGQDVAANPDADYQLKLARDLIEQGKTGYLFHEQNPELFADQIQELANNYNLYSSIAENAQKFSKLFSIETKTDELINFYEKLILRTNY
jgi:hypothetical protein